MSTSVYVMLGRIKQTSTGEHSKAFEVLDGKSVSFEDLELERCPSDDKPHQDYDLFALLAGKRRNIKPMKDPSELSGITRRLMQWLESEYNRLNPRHIHYNGDDYLYERGLEGYGGYLYSVDYLSSFDYNQVAMHKAPTDDGFVRDPDGFTYSYYLSENWFQFLDYVRTNKWDFVVFSFD